MAHLIDKDALTAEIERRVKCHAKSSDPLASAYVSEDNAIFFFIDTLEVKEVDESRYNGFLGKELKMIDDEIARLEKLKVKEVDLDSDIRTYLTNHFNIYEDGVLQSKESELPLSTYDIIKVAEHFFELGMQVSNKAQKGEEV